jgi:tetratricopeptide (TPR) repeat protein
LLEAGLRIGGFMLLYLQEYKNKASIKKKGIYRIMCIGESTTSNQYPLFLETALNEECKDSKFTVIDKGIVATTTSTIISELPHNLKTYRPDMVIAMMGINDRMPYVAYKHSPGLPKIYSRLKAYNLIRFIWLGLEKQPDRKGEILLRQAVNEHKASVVPVVTHASQGFAFWERGRHQQAQEAFKRAIQSDPRDYQSYVNLACAYWALGNSVSAEKAFKQAIQIKPASPDAYCHLGKFYKAYSRPKESEEAFKKSIDADKNALMSYLELSGLYMSEGRYDDAESILIKGIALNIDNDYLYMRLYGALARAYEAKGEYVAAKSFDKKLNDWNAGFYSPETADNFRILKKILDEYNVILVIAQYPVRSLAPLKEILKDEQNIIYVDNEKVFKDAVKSKSYETFFSDTYGGDFGHCTPKGNQLLAQNIAKVIINRLFDKEGGRR